jgi:hypothetical protein
MTDLSILANLAEILGVLIVVGGVGFAVMQMRQIRQQRRELAAIELFRFFGNPNFAEAYQMVLHLPDGMSADDIRSSQDVEHAAMLIGNTMENIGVMTHQRIVPFLIVNHLIGTSTMVLWAKLENWAMALREELGQESAFEWFQWLSERLAEHHPEQYTPAYLAHKDWQPARPNQET